MAYPIGSTRKDEVAKGVFTQTTVTLQSDGTLIGTAHTWTRNKFKGGHARASVVLFDSVQNPVWILDPPVACGVAGRWDPTGPSDRTVSIRGEVPPEAMSRASYLAVVNTCARYSIFFRWVKDHSSEIIAIAIAIFSKEEQASQPS
jgi:hypothetical protein